LTAPQSTLCLGPSTFPRSPKAQKQSSLLQLGSHPYWTACSATLAQLLSARKQGWEATTQPQQQPDLCS